MRWLCQIGKREEKLVQLKWRTPTRTSRPSSSAPSSSVTIITVTITNFAASIISTASTTTLNAGKLTPECKICTLPTSVGQLLFAFSSFKKSSLLFSLHFPLSTTTKRQFFFPMKIGEIAVLQMKKSNSGEYTYRINPSDFSRKKKELQLHKLKNEGLLLQNN